MHKAQIADVFYQNLLKSRAFFALLKWNRSISYFKILKENYLEYMIITQSRFLIKSLVYSYNRKKLIDAFIELKNRKLKNKVFNAICTKLKFRVNRGKIYLSQLFNNQYSVEFLIHISYFIFTKSYPILQKQNLKVNFDKLLAKQKFNNLKNAFEKFYKAFSISKEETQINTQRLNNFENCKVYLSQQTFFKSVAWKIKIKKDIMKFTKRLFLLRYYYNKFKKEKLTANLTKSKSLFKRFILTRIFNKFKPKKVFDINAFYRNKIKLKFLIALRQNLKNSFAIKLIHDYRQRNNKLKFFKNLRILMVESLVTQGLINKFQDFTKKKTLAILFKVCLYKKKLYFHFRKRNKILKRKVFNFLKGLRGIINQQITKYIRFIFCLFTKLVIYKKLLRKNYKNNIQRKIILFIYKSFFIRAIRMKSKMLKIDRKLVLFRLFFKTIKSQISQKKEKTINKKLLLQISFFAKMHKIIQFNFLKNAARRFILLKNSKIFFHRVTNDLDEEYKQTKLKRLVQTYYKEKLSEYLTFCYKTKNLENQIDLYYQLQLKKKALFAFKYNYSSKLKFHLLERRYKDYLIITALKYLTSYIIERNSLK
jgi:hypothetical protein